MSTKEHILNTLAVHVDTEESVDLPFIEGINKVISEDGMLNKEQAKYLEGLMENQLRRRIRNLNHAIECGRNINLTMAIDDLQVYKRVWERYTRPGTYTV